MSVKAIISSPHTTIPGILILACAIGEIWLPGYEGKFHKTIELLTAYIGVAASQLNGKQQPTVTTNTSNETTTHTS